MSLLDMELSSETLIKTVIEKHFQFWLNKFPRIEGIVFDDDHCTEEDWEWFANNPNKVHIYWQDNYVDLRIRVCKAGKDRPAGLDWGYVRYTGHSHDGGGYCYTLRKMIKEYESIRN